MRIDSSFHVAFTHRLHCTRGCLDPANPVLADAIETSDGEPADALVFVDGGIDAHDPEWRDRFFAYAESHADRMRVSRDGVRIVTGGERVKNAWSHVEWILEQIDQARLCRRSYVFAIGGGAVLDAVGFAASIAHRGVRLIRLPTTTMAQADSGVGVKNGVNAFGRKNYLGVFAPPWAVINDVEFLRTLSHRDWRAGFSEAVKVALIKDESFFEAIEQAAPGMVVRNLRVAAPIIERSARLHLEHITQGGDPFELTRARPLDFGHWSAHRLETLSDYELRHGEAVAIGIALDSTYSYLSGHLEYGEYVRIIECLTRLGFVLWHEALDDHEALFEGIDEFREHLGGRLSVPMLRGIGRGFDVHEIDRGRMRDSIECLAAQAASAGPAEKSA